MAAERGPPVTAPPPGLLAGRLAVVTGGGSGLGAAIATGLAAAGAAGMLIDQSFPAGGAVPDGWASVVADVTDPAAQAAAFGQLAGPPQVVVACAGVVPPWTSTTPRDELVTTVFSLPPARRPVPLPWRAAERRC